MLTLRPPKTADLAPLFVLADTHGTKFLDDYTEFSPEYCSNLLTEDSTIVIDDNGFAVGMCWFSDKRDDLHSTIHFLLEPKFWRQFVKQQLHKTVINEAFKSQNVSRIYAYTMDGQKVAKKLLSSLGFFSHKTWYSHTKQNGKRRDVTFHELKRSKWMKDNG